jgi:hypothetical protein
MPLVIHLRASKAIRRIAVLTCLAVFASTGVAFASCPAQPVSTPFSEWGDSSGYFLIPGASFEGTADQVDWSLSNASLTAASNEPFQVNGSSDDQSLTITSGGSATSPYFCVDNTMPDLRLFAQQIGAGSDLRVDALVQTHSGVTTVPVATLADGSMSSSWTPTAPIAGDTGAIPDGESLMVALRFEVPSSAGSWQIDDIYVDPYRAG